MEFLRGFIKEGYLKAVGKMDDYKIILGATAYFDKGILTEADLMEISEAIEKQYEEPVIEEPTIEESVETEEQETETEESTETEEQESEIVEE